MSTATTTKGLATDQRKREPKESILDLASFDDECTEFDENFAYKYLTLQAPLEGIELCRSVCNQGKYKPLTPPIIVRVGFSLR
jgi:hypothetical protein